MVRCDDDFIDKTNQSNDEKCENTEMDSKKVDEQVDENNTSKTEENIHENNKETEVEIESESETEKELKALKEENLFYQKKIKNIEDDLKKYKNESNAYRERLERLTAEYENYRNRTDKEKSEISINETGNVLKVLAPSFDNLERALAAESDDIVGLVEGVKLTLEQFKQGLDKLNVEEIPTENGFDPHYHDAMMHQGPSVTTEKKVVQVFQKGYKMKDSDRVIRHSMVVTADMEN